jgi:uncharacterized membrane protein
MEITLHSVLVFIQHIISFSGVLIILSGVIWSLSLYIYYICTRQMKEHGSKINDIRLSLGRTLILGLEFIVAADLIGTTTAPDYYSVGILASIVLIRTVLSFSLSRELMGINKKT